MNAINSVKAALYIARAGATVSSFGLAGLLWATHRWAMRTIYFDPSFFWAAAALGLAAWAVLRYRLPMPERHVWQVWHVFTRATLAVAAVLLAVSGSRAGLVDPREIAYGAAMRVDLRNLMDAEDKFFADSGAYTSDLPASLRGFPNPSAGVLGPDLSLTADGWTASVRHTSGFQSCAMFVGSTPLAPATREREPACTRPRYPFPLGMSLRALAIFGAGVGLAGLATLVARRHGRRPEPRAV